MTIERGGIFAPSRQVAGRYPERCVALHLQLGLVLRSFALVSWVPNLKECGQFHVSLP